MTDQYGLPITISGGGESPWVFARSDGLVVQRDGELSQAAASASALVTFDGLAPSIWSPPAVPDPNSFIAAIMASASITDATKAIALSSLAALTVAINAGNDSLITAQWSNLITLYSISSADQAAVSALATQFNIPGI